MKLRSKLIRLLKRMKGYDTTLDEAALEAWCDLEPTKEVARLGPERYVLLGLQNRLADDLDARLNFQFWNFAWPYMRRPKRVPPNLGWNSRAAYSLVEIGLPPQRPISVGGKP